MNLPLQKQTKLINLVLNERQAQGKLMQNFNMVWTEFKTDYVTNATVNLPATVEEQRMFAIIRVKHQMNTLLNILFSPFLLLSLISKNYPQSLQNSQENSCFATT